MTTDLQAARAIPMSDIPEEYRDIAEALGMEAFTRLTLLCGGQNLYIPKRESLERNARDRDIRARFTGGNYRALAASSASANARSARSSTAPAPDNAPGVNIRAERGRQSSSESCLLFAGHVSFSGSFSLRDARYISVTSARPWPSRWDTVCFA